jgi:ferric-dicitrate binding protein FerR (iron transport regulator)
MEEKQIKDCILMARAIRDDIAEYDTYDTDVAFSRMMKKTSMRRFRRQLAESVQRIAVVLLFPLLMATSLLAYICMERAGEDITYYTVTSAPGTVMQLSLPDSSKVWLNAGSTLRYPSRFAAGERNVFLEGEGYFLVESDKENPFFVNTGRDIRLKAYGTRFDVCYYPEDSLVETTLESGAVDVVIDNHILHLHPDEMMTFDIVNRKQTVKKVRAYEKTAWTNGRLLFRNTPLKEVVRQLSRHYNVDMELRGDTTKTHNLRATFTTETVSQALDYIKMAAPLEWSFVEAQQRSDFSYTRQKIVITLK